MIGGTAANQSRDAYGGEATDCGAAPPCSGIALASRKTLGMIDRIVQLNDVVAQGLKT
jgi:hypothetical protein